MEIRFAPLPLLLLLVCLSIPAFANHYFANIEEDLSYEYNFSQKYIVAGERVLNLTVSNNTTYNIEAIEFEIRLKSAFGDVISDWSTFTDPDLQIPAHTSKSLKLTLTRRNIFGAKLENVLEQTKVIDLRYKRILLDNDILLNQRDLYPEIAYTYGPFRIELDIINNKNTNNLREYSFHKKTFREDSIVVDNYQDLLPNATFFVIYVFDKIDGYTPKKFKVYIDGQEHYKTSLRKDGKYIADNE